MKRVTNVILVLMSILVLYSCRNRETYAEQKNRERSAINRYIAEKGVKVISEETFFAQNSMTDVSKNEFVLFESSGVYMQIINKGCGVKLKNGETASVLCRFSEYNLLKGPDSLQLSNDLYVYSTLVDKMSVKNTLGTFSASFDPTSSLIYNKYGSSNNTSVPEGWLVPLSYINLGRPINEGDEIARVKIIVPHTKGHSYATAGVYPCLYNLTYERGR